VTGFSVTSLGPFKVWAESEPNSDWVREGAPITTVALAELATIVRGLGNPMSLSSTLSTTHKIFLESMKTPTGLDMAAAVKDE